MNPDRAKTIRRRVRLLTWLFIASLVISGATAIPLESEVNGLVRLTGAGRIAGGAAGIEAPAWARWLVKVGDALRATNQQHPFLFYGTDWLAFAHCVIGIAFIGALRDPARNVWLFEFGSIACAAVIPYALVMGVLREIPFWWRLGDCSFGALGAIPLWFCRRWAGELAQSEWPSFGRPANST